MKLTVSILSSFLFILYLSGLSFAQNQNICEWIILKETTHGYKDIDFKESRSFPIFSFKEKVFGSLIKDTTKSFRSWAVKVYEGDSIIYFPYAELLQSTTFNGAEGYPIGKEKVDIHTSLPIDYYPKDLVQIDQKWNYHQKDYPKLLRKEAQEALIQMLEKAQSEGIHLLVVSAFRDFAKQRTLYLRAIKNRGIEQVGTAKPSHSEHQLGTTVDLTSRNRADLLSLSFDETPEGKWLQENANEFGFHQTYTKKDPKGYMPEPWHYRYIKPN